MRTQLMRELNGAHTSAMKQGLKALPQLVLGSATDQVVTAVFHRMLAVDLQDGQVRSTRAHEHSKYAAKFQLCMFFLFLFCFLCEMLGRGGTHTAYNLSRACLLFKTPG